MKPELFKCQDGDQWWSLVEGDELVTGVMHDSLESAESERMELMALTTGE